MSTTLQGFQTYIEVVGYFRRENVNEKIVTVGRINKLWIIDIV